MFSRPLRQHCRFRWFKLSCSACSWEIYVWYPLVPFSLALRYSLQNQRIVDMQRTQITKLMQDCDAMRSKIAALELKVDELAENMGLVPAPEVPPQRTRSRSRGRWACSYIVPFLSQVLLKRQSMLWTAHNPQCRCLNRKMFGEVGSKLCLICLHQSWEDGMLFQISGKLFLLPACKHLQTDSDSCCICLVRYLVENCICHRLGQKLLIHPPRLPAVMRSDQSYVCVNFRRWNALFGEFRKSCLFFPAAKTLRGEYIQAHRFQYNETEIHAAFASCRKWTRFQFDTRPKQEMLARPLRWPRVTRRINGLYWVFAANGTVLSFSVGRNLERDCDYTRSRFASSL